MQLGYLDFSAIFEIGGIAVVIGTIARHSSATALRYEDKMYEPHNFPRSPFRCHLLPHSHSLTIYCLSPYYLDVILKLPKWPSNVSDTPTPVLFHGKQGVPLPSQTLRPDLKDAYVFPVE